MASSLMSHETLLRLVTFFGLFFIFIALELYRPFRIPAQKRFWHYGRNLSLILLSSSFIHLLFPLVAVGAATIASTRGWGLFNVLAAPEWLSFLCTVVLFDLLLYLQHRAFHSWDWLWRLHRVHHSDPDFDTSTGIRFHPLEIILSMMLKILAALSLGAHPAGVVLFEILLNASSLFSHLNIQLPERVDRTLRWLFVTPGMHRVHHSIRPDEMNSNFGFHLTLWDYLFRTYRERPLPEQKTMPIGVEGFSDEPLPRLLVQPFRVSN